MEREEADEVREKLSETKLSSLTLVKDDVNSVKEAVIRSSNRTRR
jgi:hypothetical protein